MSPSPDLSPKQPSPTDPMPSELELESPTQTTADSPDPESSAESDKAESPVLRKPPMRPVRPQPAADQGSGDTGAVTLESKPLTKPVSSKLEIVSVSSPSTAGSSSGIVSHSQPSPVVEMDAATQAALRQQPIPPPSEPKQYRAIGLVRGLYTPSEEEFTRGDFKATDGSDLKAVLLGRVMSLVKNHIDLQKEHLWVVYPRTREEEKELHLQIVGVWEPETLKKADQDGEEGISGELADGSFIDPRLQDDYFSVRGEIVFIAPDDHHIVVKIQQTPRKASQKAKAFKLALRGELDHTRTVGYFWELHVKREDNTLVVTEGNCIGMAPPKKRDKDAMKQGRPTRPFRSGSSKVPGRSPRPGLPPRPNREPAAKPIKRSEQNPTSEA